jgi:hypothetical protein
MNKKKIKLLQAHGEGVVLILFTFQGNKISFSIP